MSLNNTLFSSVASMKGGRTAPRDIGYLLGMRPAAPRFNEGGADCPPRLLTLLVAIGLGEIGLLREGGDFLFGE